MREIPDEFCSFLRPCTQEDIEYLAANMRGIDKRECRLISGATPHDALQRGFESSPLCFTIFHPQSGKLLAIGGLGQPGNVVWLLLHKCALRDPFVRSRFARFSRRMLRWLLSQAPGGYMVNVTLSRNFAVVRWLTWLGATFLSNPPQGLVHFRFYAKEVCPCVAPQQ